MTVQNPQEELQKKNPNDFSLETIRVLYNRAGQRCSHCKRPTSGGNTNEGKATIIGEAAHIKGANPYSPRYEAKMTIEQRRSPSNGIWLCANCHTEIDKDPIKFPAELVYKWKVEHEGSVLNLEPINPNLANFTASQTTQFSNKSNGNTVVNNNYNIIYTGTVSQNYPDPIFEQVKNMAPTPSPIDNNDENLSITLSQFMGIVKSPDLPGTRVQLEFTISNTQDAIKIIKGSYLKLNGGQVHFKKFFKINENSSREPDYVKRFPIVINTRGADRLAIEYENLEGRLIQQGELNGELVMLTGEGKVASKKFIFEVNKAMEDTLSLLQQASLEKQMPIVFDAAIKS